MLYTSNKIKCYTTSNKIKCYTNRDQKAINCGVEAVVGVAVWRGGRGGGSGEGMGTSGWRTNAYSSAEERLNHKEVDDATVCPICQDNVTTHEDKVGLVTFCELGR